MRLYLVQECREFGQYQRAVRTPFARIGKIKLDRRGQGAFVARNAGNEHRRLVGCEAANVKMVERAETDAGVLRACQIGLEFCVACARAFDRGDVSEIDTRCAKLRPIGTAIALGDHNALHRIFSARRCPSSHITPARIDRERDAEHDNAPPDELAFTPSHATLCSSE